MLETAHRTVPGFRIARIRKVARPAAETARSACLSAGPAVPFPPPWGGRSPPYVFPRLAAVACLARYASSLAGVTFAPAQPPSVINSPCEKTNLTQKQPPPARSARRSPALRPRRHDACGKVCIMIHVPTVEPPPAEAFTFTFTYTEANSCTRKVATVCCLMPCLLGFEPPWAQRLGSQCS